MKTSKRCGRSCSATNVKQNEKYIFHASLKTSSAKYTYLSKFPELRPPIVERRHSGNAWAKLTSATNVYSSCFFSSRSGSGSSLMSAAEALLNTNAFSLIWHLRFYSGPSDERRLYRLNTRIFSLQSKRFKNEAHVNNTAQDEAWNTLLEHW